MNWILWFVFYWILLSAFVGWCIEYQIIHCLTNKINWLKFGLAFLTNCRCRTGYVIRTPLFNSTSFIIYSSDIILKFYSTGFYSRATHLRILAIHVQILPSNSAFPSLYNSVGTPYPYFMNVISTLMNLVTENVVTFQSREKVYAARSVPKETTNYIW
jgi:hypothetical protein